MKSTLLSIVSDEHAASLRVAFPPRVLSTNVERLRAEMEEFLQSVDAKTHKWQHLELDFKKTEFVDSIGLNFIFELVKTAEVDGIDIVAWVVSRAVRLTFYTVRLDKRMDIRLVDAQATKQ